MSGYLYSSTYLLQMFKRLVGRPQLADAVTDTTYYQRLSDAQAQIIADIAAVCPNVLYQVTPVALTTTDNHTFTFGTDPQAYATAPIGKAKIYSSLEDVPLFPLQPGVDYFPVGGTSIQAPGTQTIPGTLYGRWIEPPQILDGTGFHEPSLLPEPSRVLIAYRAAAMFLLEGGRAPDQAATYVAMYGRPLHPTLPGLFAQWCLAWRTSFAGGGALASVTGQTLALSGQTVS